MSSVYFNNFSLKKELIIEQELCYEIYLKLCHC